MFEGGVNFLSAIIAAQVQPIKLWPVASFHWQSLNHKHLICGHAESWNSVVANSQAAGLLMAVIDWLIPEHKAERAHTRNTA